MALTLTEAVNILQSGDWVGLRLITADVKKGTGGKVLDIPKCRIARGVAHAAAGKPSAAEIYTAGKNPNHNLNFTRNVELPNKQLRKVHPILITHLNNQPVL